MPRRQQSSRRAFLNEAEAPPRGADIATVFTALLLLMMMLVLLLNCSFVYL